MAREVMLNPIGVAAADPRIAVPRADMSGPAAVEAVGELGGEIISNVQQGRAQREISNITEDLYTVYEMKEQGVQLDSEGNVIPETLLGASAQLQAKLANVERVTSDRMKRLALATEQGRYQGRMAADLEYETEIRKLMRQTPGFEQEIRRTAASVLGFDPMGAAIRQLLDIEAPTKTGGLTEIEKFDQMVDLRYYQARNSGVNVSRDMIRATMSQAGVREMQNQHLKIRVEAGELNVDQAISEMISNNTIHPLTAAVARITSDIAQSEQTGGSYRGWKDTADLTRSAQAAMEEEIQSALVSAKNLGGIVGLDQEKRIREHFQARYEPVIALIQDSSMTEMLKNKFEQINLLSKAQGWDMAPGLMSMNEAFGPQITSKLIDVMSNSINPGGMSMLSQYFPGLLQIFGRDKLADGSAIPTYDAAARNIWNGENNTLFGPNGKSLTQEQQAIVEAEVANAVTNLADNRAQYTAAIQGMKDNRPDLAIAQLAKDPDSFSRVAPAEREKVKSFVQADRVIILGSVAETLSVNDIISVDPETGMILSEMDAARPSLKKVVEGMTGAGGAFNMRGNRVTPNDPSSGAIASLNHHIELLRNPQWRQYLMPNATSFESAVTQLETELQLAHVRAGIADASRRAAGNALVRKGLSKEAWIERAEMLKEQEYLLNGSLAYYSGYRAQ